jgi:XTP/dITP diphosphohydrolase
VAAVRAVLASGNAHKLAELRAALPGWELELLGRGPLPEETGETYVENARAKARFGRAVADAGVWVLGEDSGIEVVALDGGPGIASARWAEDGVAEILARLEGVEERRARYVCELVALGPDGEERHGTGTLEGTISAGRRGDEGFGYDPIFVPVGETRTVAELGNDWKRANSHRARAARALRETMSRRRVGPRSGPFRDLAR